MPGLAKGTDTIFFIDKSNVPTTRCKDNIYVCILVNYIPEKSHNYRRCLTIGRNQVNYPHDCGMPTSNLLIVKLLLNSVVFTPVATFITVDIKYFNSTPLCSTTNTCASDSATSPGIFQSIQSHLQSHQIWIRLR